MASSNNDGREIDRKYLNVFYCQASQFRHDDFDLDEARSPYSLCSHYSRSPGRNSNGSRSPARPGSRSPLPDKHRSRKDSRHRLSEVELKQKIQALEDTVADYEKQKHSVMGTFSEFRERLAEKERVLETEYSSKIISLSEEVLAAKRDFERRMKEYQDAQEKYEREKEAALQKLKQEHQKEIAVLEKRCSDSSLMNLEQKYMIEIQRLEEERKALRSEKDRLGEAFEVKVKRAQTLYETELSASKALYTNDLEALKDHERALREELGARQEEFKDRLDELSLQLTKRREEMVELEERLKEKQGEVEQISKQLDRARKETDEALKKLRAVEALADSSQQKYAQAHEQLLLKTAMVDELQQVERRMKGIIRELQQQISSMQSKVTFLENERQNLESQSRSQAHLQDSQLQALQSFVDNLTSDKDALTARYEKELQDQRAAFQQSEDRLQAEYNEKLSELEAQLKHAEGKIASKMQKDEQTIDEEIEKLVEERCNTLRMEKTELEGLKEQLSAQLNLAEQQLQQLRSEAAEKESWVQGAKDQIAELTAVAEKLNVELEQSRLNADKLNQAEFSGENGIEVGYLREKIKGELREELEKYYSENAKQIRAELEGKLCEERDLLVQNLQNQLEEKLQNSRLEWERQEQSYQQQISQLQQLGAEMRGDGSSEEVQQLQQVIDGLNSEIGRLQAKLVDFEGADEKGSSSGSHQLQEKQLIEAGLSACREMESSAQIDHLREQIQKETDEGSAQQFEEVERYKSELHSLRAAQQAKQEEQEAMSEQLRSRVSQVQCLEEQVQGLKGEMQQISEQLQEKTRKMVEIRKNTKEYVLKRETKFLRDREHCEAKLKQEIAELERRLAEASSATGVGGFEDPELADQLQKLKEKLSEKENDIKRLLSEKSSLESELEVAKQCCRKDSMSSFGGSYDHLSRKRDSVCSSTSSERNMPTVSQRANMAIIHKWHCLVKQLTDNQDGCRGQASSRTPATTRDKSPRSQQRDSKSPSHQHRESRATTRLSASGQSNLLRPDGCDRSPAGRRTGKSPSHSPAPKAKPLVPNEQRPAWRI